MSDLPDDPPPPRRGRGRPRVGHSHQVRLDAHTAAIFRALGHGNLSAGIREGARQLRAAGLAPAAAEQPAATDD